MLSSDFVTAPLLMFTLSSNLCYSTRSVSTQRTDYSQYTGLRTLAATTPPPSRPTNERDSQFHKKIPRPTHCHSSHPQHFSRATSSLSKVPPQKGGAQTPLCKCRTFSSGQKGEYFGYSEYSAAQANSEAIFTTHVYSEWHF
jgi:hypothetical protein